jgi:hypothetical protein
MITARILFVAAVVACGSAQAQNRPCSKADSANAEKAIERASTWPQLAKAFKDWKHCDGNAAVADLYAESLVRLIVEWKNLDAFAAEMKNPEFKAFAHEHLKRPIAKDDLDSVYGRAKAECPAKHADFCAELAEFAKTASK